MIIHDQTRFPHPVLSPDTDDFDSGEFNITFTIKENPEKSRLTLDCEVHLTEPQIRQAVEAGRAAVGFYANCPDTYHLGLNELPLSGGGFDFDPGVLYGPVTIRPLVWAKETIPGFDLTNCHEEFGGGTLDFEPGTILAFGEEQRFSVGHEKLAHIESIFTLSMSDQIEAGSFSLDLDSERITILVAANIFETVTSLRGMGVGKAILLNSVYLPAVMTVLGVVSGDAASYAERRWYRIFAAKCDVLGVSLDQPEIWEDAQKVLEAPFVVLHENREIIGS